MKLTLREWQKKFNEGIYNDIDIQTQIAAGWYDWFCRPTSLANKTKKLGAIVKQIKDGGKVDLDNTYVWFKNNCPMVGPLYDDFRIADLDSGHIIFTVAVNDKRSKYRYEVWGKHNEFDKPIIGFDDSRKLVKWLNTPWEE